MIPRLFSTLVPKDQVPIEVVVGEERFAVPVPTRGGYRPVSASAESIASPAALSPVTVPLITLAVARSGDKGDHANIGVAARKSDYLPYLEAALTADAVRDWFAHVLAGSKAGVVERWSLPGSHSLNFLLRHALGGGGAASLRTDPQGKAFAQMLLEFPVPVPAELARALASAAG